MILADSGALIAAWDSRESQHRAVSSFLRASESPIVLPSPAVVEVAHYLGRRLGPDHEARFLQAIGTGRIHVEDPVLEDYGRAAELVLEYADFPLGTVDALIVAMAERLGVRTVLTLDRRHFGVVRPRHCAGFALVP